MTARALKVFGTYLMLRRAGQKRVIVAARSKAEAARLLGITPHYARSYLGETGNPVELAAARSAPGSLFYEKTRDVF